MSTTRVYYDCYEYKSATGTFEVVKQGPARAIVDLLEQQDSTKLVNSEDPYWRQDDLLHAHLAQVWKQATGKPTDLEVKFEFRYESEWDPTTKKWEKPTNGGSLFFPLMAPGTDPVAQPADVYLCISCM